MTAQILLFKTQETSGEREREDCKNQRTGAFCDEVSSINGREASPTKSQQCGCPKNVHCNDNSRQHVYTDQGNLRRSFI